MNQRRRRVTIKDVAREAGVAPATVSNWINERRISPGTSAIVAAVAARLGYRPSGLARSMRGHPTSILGLIVPSVTNHSMPAIVRGAEDRASEAGYLLFVSNIDRDWEKALEHTLAMIDHDVDGLAYAFSVATPADPAVKAAREAGVPVGLLLPSRAGSDQVASVVLDNASAMDDAAEHLWGLGHRRVGYVSMTASTNSGPERLASLRLALRARGGDVPDSFVYIDDVSGPRFTDYEAIECGRRGAAFLLSKPDRPTAICAVTDLLAVGFLQAARELGFRVPEDVSIVGFDDLAVARVASPPLTTLAVPGYALGQTLIDVLLEAARADGSGHGVGSGTPPTTHVVSATLVARGSTGPVPERAHNARRGRRRPSASPKRVASV